MTTYREYACNLCHSRQSDKIGPTERIRIRGAIHKTGGGINLVGASESENHICTDCIEAIKAAKP